MMQRKCQPEIENCTLMIVNDTVSVYSDKATCQKKNEVNRTFFLKNQQIQAFKIKQNYYEAQQTNILFLKKAISQ